MEPYQENSQKQALPQEPPHASQKLLETKKVHHSPLFFLFLIVLGFGIAAAAFAFFSKSAATKKMSAKSQQKAALPVSNQTSGVSVEVIPQALPQAPIEATQEAPEKALPVLTLNGILFGPQGSLALINGKVVPEGGQIDGAKIEKISADRVELTFEGKKIILKTK